MFFKWPLPLNLPTLEIYINVFQRWNEIFIHEHVICVISHTKRYRKNNNKNKINITSQFQHTEQTARYEFKHLLSNLNFSPIYRPISHFQQRFPVFSFRINISSQKKQHKIFNDGVGGNGDGDGSDDQ